MALATAVAVVVVGLVLARHLASGEEYDLADAFFEPQAAATDRASVAAPIASTPAASSAPAPSAPAPSTPAASARAADTPAAPAMPAAVTRGVRPIAERKAIAEAARTPPSRRLKTAVEASTATSLAAPAAEAPKAEEATATAADAGATEIAPTAAAAAAMTVDEVTITGCLEVDKEADRFRLADTEGTSVPKARSWRSGFFKKRAAAVDLMGSADALSLNRQVGQRVAATGVLTNHTLKVTSMRMVSPSCN